MIAGTWLAVKRSDERAFALYRRHYSAGKGARWRRPGNTNADARQSARLLVEALHRIRGWVSVEPSAYPPLAIAP